jgi:mRNA interferase MazF
MAVMNEAWRYMDGGGGNDNAGRPRPVVIVQDDSFGGTDSITICAFTSDATDAPLLRLQVEPNEPNGLRAMSRLMVDKVTTVPKSKIATQVWRLDEEDIVRLNQAMMVFSDWQCHRVQEKGLDRAVSRKGRKK